MLPESNLNELVRLINTAKSVSSLHEANTKATIITPILKALNWNVNSHYEVKREYPIEGIGRVDYALNVADDIKVLIEAKAMKEDLNKYEQQIRKYATENTPLFILTNGIRWEFYTWLRKGIGIHNFYILDFNIHDKLIIAEELYSILSKESIISTLSCNHIKNIIAKDISKFSSYAAIDVVLNNILDEPSILLCNMIVAQVYEAFNRTVEYDDVKKIIKDYNEAFKSIRDVIRIGFKSQQDISQLSKEDRVLNKLKYIILKLKKKKKNDIIPIREIMPYVQRQITSKETNEAINTLCSIGFCELVGRKIKILNQEAEE